MTLKTYYVVETYPSSSRHDTYGEAVHQAEAMSRITGLPSLIFKAISYVTVTDNTTTLTVYNDDLP